MKVSLPEDVKSVKHKTQLLGKKAACVSQDSVLGTLLFSFFINNIFLFSKNVNLQVILTIVQPTHLKKKIRFLNSAKQECKIVFKLYFKI